MAYIGNIAQTAFTSFDKQTITGTGGATYTLSHNVANEQEIEVFVNNVRQEGGAGKAYTCSGNQITFTENIANTDSVYVVFQGKALQTVVPPAGSVTDSMITGLSSSKLTGALPAIDGSNLTGVSGGGKVLQVKSITKTDATSTASQTFGDITGLSISITPSATSSKILVFGTVNASEAGDFVYVRLMRDTTPLAVGVPGSNRPLVSAAGYPANTYQMHALSMSHLDEPSSTSALTYKWQIRSGSGANTAYVNRTVNDRNTSHYESRGASNITVMEIGV